MIMEYHLRDLYDWNPDVTEPKPLVSDQQMSELHRAGMAREYEITGTMVIEAVWKKRQTLDSGATYSVK